jgi:predicted transcriptional regulator
VNGGVAVRFLVVLATLSIVVGGFLVNEEKKAGNDDGDAKGSDLALDGIDSDDGNISGNSTSSDNRSSETSGEDNSSGNSSGETESGDGGGVAGDSASDSDDGSGGDDDSPGAEADSSEPAASEEDTSESDDSEPATAESSFDSQKMADDTSEDSTGAAEGNVNEPSSSRSLISELSVPEGLVVGGGAALGSLAIGALFTEVMKVAILVGLVVPVMAARRKNREDMMTRGRLLGYLEANAGIHFSALRDALGLANGVSAYHLQVLESSGQIISWRDGKLRRYAVATLSQEEAKRVKNPIAGTRLAILEVLADSGNFGLSGSEIRIKLAISRQLLSHHLAELRASELVVAASQAKRPKWRVSLDGQDTLEVSRQIARAEAAA